MLDLSFTEFHTLWCNLYFTFVSNNLHICDMNMINSKLEIILNAKWIKAGNYIPKSNISHIEGYRFNIFKPMFFIDGFNFFAFHLYIENKPYQCRYKQLFKVNWIMSLMTKHFVFEILDSRIFCHFGALNVLHFLLKYCHPPWKCKGIRFCVWKEQQKTCQALKGYPQTIPNKLHTKLV